MMNFLFNLIEPPRANTWLSRRFFYWKQKKHQRLIRAFKMNFDGRYFDVPGAGLIAISEDCHRTTGKVAGFSFGVEWGVYGFCGGVLGRDEAKKLAEFILEKCSEVSETMEEEVARNKRFHEAEKLKS